MAGEKIWPADKVERRDIGTLTAYQNNPRTHSKAQVAQIANSIREFGFAMPVLLDEDGVIIAGHARVRAAQSLKLAQVPVMVAHGWSDAQKRAYVMADNRLSLSAGWDDDLLKLELGDLKLEGFDLALTGFTTKELDAYLAPAPLDGLTDPDEMPDAAAVPRVWPGDVWQLGQHTLICGSCLDVLPRLGDVPNAVVGAVITDPPYGIGLKYDQHNDTDYPGGYGAWIWDIIERAEAMCPPGAPIFVWQSPKTIRNWGQWFPRDWQLFVGARNFVGTIPKTAMFRAYDAVLAWWKEGGDPWTAATGNRDWHLADTASALARPENLQRAHPCPRPVDQVQNIIEQWVPPGTVILEPFSGSGTTLLVAEITGRVCHAVELSPSYCDIAIRRWEAFTGKTAICEREAAVAA